MGLYKTRTAKVAEQIGRGIVVRDRDERYRFVGDHLVRAIESDTDPDRIRARRVGKGKAVWISNPASPRR